MKNILRLMLTIHDQVSFRIKIQIKEKKNPFNVIYLIKKKKRILLRTFHEGEPED